MFFLKKKVKALEITDQNYNEIVMNSDQPILLDFWNTGCGPCNVLGPFVDNVANNYKGKALVGKVHTSANPMLAQHFKVRSVPRFCFSTMVNSSKDIQG